MLEVMTFFLIGGWTLCRSFVVVVVGTDGLVRAHTDHWSLASLLETKIGWIYRPCRRVFGAATSLMLGWLTTDSTPLVLEGHAPTAPPPPPPPPIAEAYVSKKD